jgi:hypothetical protein
MHLLGDLADASTEATHAISSYIQYLEEELAPKARASFRLGQEQFERKLALDESISIDAERLLNIALREFQATQEQFRLLAGKLNGTDPIEAWRRAKDAHPAAGAISAAAQEQLDELSTFIDRNGIITRPEGDVWARFIVRMLEIYESLRILKQALDGLPEGPIMPEGKRQYQVRVPPGEAYSRIEGAKGELGFYVVSDGKPNPYRYHVRAPTFINLTSLEKISLGHKIADAVVILGAVDIILGEVDR